MQYYRNFELSNLYGVSRSAVGKWVEAAGRGKLSLTLIDIDGKSYIANTAKNHDAIKAMVEDRKKYFNRTSLKTVAPKPEFYELFSAGQIADIISNLQVHREIPRQYNYLDGGAARWDEYSKDLYNQAPPGLAAQVLQVNEGYLDYLFDHYKRVNIIDIGPGNALPVKNLLSRLLDAGKLGRYLAIDISPEMLEIAHKNINEWFGGAVPFEGAVRDIGYERFTDLMADKYDEESINVVLFLGGTLYNFREPNEVLRTIHHSLAPPDLLVCTQKLDTAANRRYFDFSPTEGMSPNHLQRPILDLMNIDESFYSVEVGYDEKLRQRFIRVRFDVALSIEFTLGTSTRRVDIAKGEKLLLWQFWHQNAAEMISQFERNGFDVLQMSETKGHAYSMIVCDLKTESE